MFNTIQHTSFSQGFALVFSCLLSYFTAIATSSNHSSVTLSAIFSSGGQRCIEALVWNVWKGLNNSWHRSLHISLWCAMGNHEKAFSSEAWQCAQASPFMWQHNNTTWQGTWMWKHKPATKVVHFCTRDKIVTPSIVTRRGIKYTTRRIHLDCMHRELWIWMCHPADKTTLDLHTFPCWLRLVYAS